MTQPIQELQNHFQFQLSLLRLLDTQPAENTEQEYLQYAIDRTTDVSQRGL